jgi:hypothetical protein
VSCRVAILAAILATLVGGIAINRGLAQCPEPRPYVLLPEGCPCGVRPACGTLTLHILPTGASASDDMIRDREAAFQDALQLLEVGRYREAIPILCRLNEASLVC